MPRKGNLPRGKGALESFCRTGISAGGGVEAVVLEELGAFRRSFRRKVD